MMRFFLWLLPFFLVVGLFADEGVLKRAETYMQSGTQSDIFRAYNDYKNLYLQSMVSNDENLKLASLNGIVASGTKLEIDVATYASELKTLSAKNSTGYNQPEPKPMKKTKHIEEVQFGELAKLKSVKWRENTLLFVFDQPIGAQRINYFTLHDAKKKNYRYVFDIKTSMLTSSHNISKKGIDKIKIGQFNPEALRLVIENKAAIVLSHNVNETTLEVTFGFEAPKSQKIAPEVADKTAAPLKIKGKKIVIDPGHGGTDPGAIGHNGYREKMVVFNISQEVVKILKSRGHMVYMTRDEDEFVKLSKRTEFANDKKADIFVSIHANAVPNGNAHEVHGIECYFLSPSRSERAKKAAAQENSADMSDMNMYGKDSYLNLLNHHNILASNKLAIDLQRGMLGALNPKYKDVRDSGVKEGPFWVLVGAQMPSVLIEVGFISHPQEASRLVDNEYVRTMARGMADGIERYFVNN